MVNDLFFHIHYCNGGKREPGEFRPTMMKMLSHHELLLVTAGTGSITVRGKRHPFQSGMLLYIAPNVPHALEMRADAPAGLLTVHFSCARVRLSDGKWDVRDEARALPLSPARALSDARGVEELFKKLVDGWYAKLPRYEFEAKTQLQQLLIKITQNETEESPNYAAARKVEKVIAFMLENLGGKVTLDGLSRLVQLSPAYLSRVFRKATGCTVIEYFTKLKIDKAKELLPEGGKKVREVSQLLGFADEFYFSRTFKRLVGVSPSEFYSRIVHEV
ncbi:AraC-type DNA-binding protein [Sporobacter termitidis DSM 10068]|uniref:AraC-type DNA-binding protein n=1 Tax=Sporobacter termitidis DSM 10068 TaxID=1123282 RepID=A0A1M5XS87_9FIRM|nr:AraC family transcriptional regulator [Sporobacter termitidis]SHI02532.1 AraC-type DNA-binding protein [Sporobacter termitidis DSM 10068]